MQHVFEDGEGYILCVGYRAMLDELVRFAYIYEVNILCTRVSSAGSVAPSKQVCSLNSETDRVDTTVIWREESLVEWGQLYRCLTNKGDRRGEFKKFTSDIPLLVLW